MTHLGFTTRARNTRCVSSASVRVFTSCGIAESPTYAAGLCPVRWRTIASVKGNYQRRCVVEFPAVTADRLRIIVEATMSCSRVSWFLAATAIRR